MTWLAWGVLALVAAERLGELFIARRNTAKLLADGAFEVGRGHYPLIVAVHTAWIAALVARVAMTPIEISFAWLGIYLALQIFRGWVMLSLGRYWTTRIIVVPNAPLVRSGPYKFLRHPNYAVVVAEILVLPMVYGAWWIAAVFTMLNGMALAIRIGAENRALAGRQGLSSAAAPAATTPQARQSSAMPR